MAQDLSKLVPQLLAKGLLALRGSTVMPQIVNRDFGAQTSAKGKTIDVPIPSAITANDVVPAASSQAVTDITPLSVPITLSNWKEGAFTLSDKEMGEVVDDVFPMNASEAIKVLAEEVNLSVFNEYPGIYGFFGIAGTTPFPSQSSADATKIRRILQLQKAPLADRRLVLDPDAEAAALQVAGFQDASFRGDTAGILEAQIGRKFGFDWFADQQVVTHTAGTITTGFIAKAATGVAVGLKTLIGTTAASTGAIALLKGDILHFVGDTQTYVLTADATESTAATDAAIFFEPGLKIALVGSEAITVEATHVVNLAFHRDAFALASRPLESGGSELGGSIIESVVDPVTGLALRLEVRREHKRVRWSYDILWGVKLVRPELAARLAG